jgi:hypothetical protein
MHKKTDPISFFNTPSRLARINTISVEVNLHYISDIPQYCFKVSQPLAIAPSSLVKLSNKLEEIGKGIPTLLKFSQKKILSESLARSELKTSLLLCESFFEDEIDSARLISDFSDQILMLTNTKDGVYANSYPIEDT